MPMFMLGRENEIIGELMGCSVCVCLRWISCIDTLLWERNGYEDNGMHFGSKQFFMEIAKDGVWASAR